MISQIYNEQMGNYFTKLAQMQTQAKGKQQPLTNADRIRAMTDEELADVFDHVQGDAFLVGIGHRKNSAYPGAGISWLDWLKQEVEDGDT